ncbi:MAG: hypothetical protein IJ794_04075 [Lachnospiraceae bacterium]|nr:hypothetical protein [Lachnospiraceae bacterium]
MNQVVANVTVIFCVAACVFGGIFAWWVENRPEDGAGTDGYDERIDKNEEQEPNHIIKESETTEKKHGKREKP